MSTGTGANPAARELLLMPVSSASTPHAAQASFCQTDARVGPPAVPARLDNTLCPDVMHSCLCCGFVAFDIQCPCRVEMLPDCVGNAHTTARYRSGRLHPSLYWFCAVSTMPARWRNPVCWQIAQASKQTGSRSCLLHAVAGIIRAQGSAGDYLITAFSSPLAYLPAIFSRSTGLILAAWPAEPKAS